MSTCTVSYYKWWKQSEIKLPSKDTLITWHHSYDRTKITHFICSFTASWSLYMHMHLSAPILVLSIFHRSQPMSSSIKNPSFNVLTTLLRGTPSMLIYALDVRLKTFWVPVHSWVISINDVYVQYNKLATVSFLCGTLGEFICQVITM